MESDSPGSGCWLLRQMCILFNSTLLIICQLILNYQSIESGIQLLELFWRPSSKMNLKIVS